MKACTRCGLSEGEVKFRPSYRFCEKCRAKANTAARAKDPQKWRAVASAYIRLNHEKVREQHRMAMARYSNAHPERRRAHSALWKAVKAGKLTRPSRCEICNLETNTEAHHADYSKPLSVNWLCKPCHEQHHHDG